jgi:hypothetical protein
VANPYSGPHVEALRKNLAALVTEGLMPYNIAEKGGELLELQIVTSRLGVIDDADEDVRDQAYAAALVAVLDEAVKDRILFRKYRRLLRYVLPLREGYLNKPIEARRKAAGKNLTDGKKVVQAGTIRTYYEPRALDALAQALVEMEAQKRGEASPVTGV